MWMNTIGVMASVVGALVGLITIWNSKWNILKRIDRKERQVKILEQKLYLKHGVNRPIGGPVTPLEMKIVKLRREIAELHRKL